MLLRRPFQQGIVMLNIHSCWDAHCCANSLNTCSFVDNVFPKKCKKTIKGTEQLPIVLCSHFVIVIFFYIQITTPLFSVNVLHKSIIGQAVRFVHHFFILLYIEFITINYIICRIENNWIWLFKSYILIPVYTIFVNFIHFWRPI